MRDEKKRCCGCGAIDQISPNCPKKGGRDRPKNKVMKEEEDVSSSTSPSKGAETNEESTVKSLLEEANKMLKFLTKEDSGGRLSDQSKNGTLEAL